MTTLTWPALRGPVWAAGSVALMWVLASVMAVAAQTPSPSDAPDPRSGEVAFRIDAQPIDRALKEFASQANLQLVYETTEISPNIRSSHVAGSFTPEAALSRLLAHTNLDYKFINDRTVSIRSSEDAPRSRTHLEKESAPRGVQPGFAKAEPADLPDASSEQPAAADLSTERDVRHLARRKDIEEVVVTASKRAELLSKAPLAVSALDMNQLQDAGVVGIRDMTSAVPDLQIHTIGVDGFVGITIRGISNQDYSGTANPAVSTYIDGTYIGLSQGFANELYDIERVEILRGPQGTLYGRNATGGNVNIITADPKNTFGASVDASFGNYRDVQTRGMVNVPLSDQLQIRAAFMTHRNDGYFDTRGTTARNYGASDDFGARVTALWTPVSQFKWRLSLDGFVSKGTPWASIETGVDGKPVNGPSPYHQPIGADPEPVNDLRNTAVRSRMDWVPSDSIDVSYVAGYQKLHQDNLYWATTGLPGAPATAGWTQFYQYWATFLSQEIDINYETKRLRNVFGGSYFGQEQPNGAQSGIAAAIDLSYVSPNSNAKSHKDAWGVFDQATYSLTDRLRVTGGVRFSRESQFVAAVDWIYCPVLPNVTTRSLYAMTTFPASCGPGPTPAASGHWSSTTWKTGLEFDLSDQTLTYLSVTTGFKSGGVQPGLPAPLAGTFAPEHVKSYELGTKTRLLNDSLNLRAAAFYEDYTDLQVFQLVAVPGAALALATLNAAKARIYGVELESEWHFSGVDQIRGFANYLHATYTEFNNAYDGRTLGTVPSVTGNQLPNAPQEAFRLQYTHDFRLGNGGTVTPLAAVYWQSTSYLQPFNTSYYQQDAYSKTNLSLTYTWPEAHWKVTGYADNLENNAVRNSNWAYLGVYSDYAPPRIFGIRVSYQE